MHLAGLIFFLTAGQDAWIVGDAVPPESKEKAKKAIMDKVEAFKNSTEQQQAFVKAYPQTAAQMKAALESLNKFSDVQYANEAEKDTVTELIYSPGSRTFYALTAKEVQELDQASKYLEAPMAALNTVNDSEHGSAPVEDNASAILQKTKTLELKQTKINVAKNNVIKNIKPLVSGPKSSKITEVVRLKGKKYTYVASDKMKNHWRSYRLDADDRKASVMKRGKFDTKKLIKQMKKESEKSLKWDIDWAKCNGSWGEWAESFNAMNDITLFGDPKDPKSVFYATDDAQLFRYSTGATLKGGFNPAKGQFSFTDEVKAEFAVAEAKSTMKYCIPDNEGWILKFTPHYEKNGKTVTLPEVDFGAIMAAFEMNLSGFAGASANLCANLVINTDLDKGVLRFKGKENVEEAKIAGDVFLGIKAGCEGKGSISWRSPEKGMEWNELASDAASGEGAAGIGAKGEFYVDFNRITGKFLLHASAGIVCGVGVSGSITLEIDAKNIYEFVTFIYHKIKDECFKFIGFMAGDAMDAIVNMFTKLFVDELQSLEAVAKTELKTLSKWWNDFWNVDFFSDNEKLNEMLKIADGINNNTDVRNFKFMTPETKGRLLYLLSEPEVLISLHDADKGATMASLFSMAPAYSSLRLNAEDKIHRLENAMVKILSYIQTKNEYNNVLQHMSPNLEKVPLKESERRLYNELGVYGVSQKGRLKNSKIKIDSAHNLLVFQDDENLPKNTPVKQNNEIKNS